MGSSAEELRAAIERRLVERLLSSKGRGYPVGDWQQLARQVGQHLTVPSVCEGEALQHRCHDLVRVLAEVLADRLPPREGAETLARWRAGVPPDRRSLEP